MKTRTDAMGRVDRRLALGGGLAAAAGLAWPRPQIKGRVVIQRGIVGGGVVALGEDDATFSVFASSLAGDESAEGELVFLGRVQWFDQTADLALVSTAITDYQITNRETGEEGESRRMRGTMSANGQGEHPFVMDVLDAGDPDAGESRVTLAVGVSAGVGEAATPAADLGFRYAAEGAIVSGDVQVVDFAVDIDTGAVTDPGPAS